MELQQELKVMAVSLGLCQQWQDQWGMPDSDELVGKYVEGIDFAIQHDFPSIEYIESNFSKEVLRRNGVYCNDKIIGKKRVMVLLGNSSGEIRLNDFEVVTVYARHDSEVKISVSDFASVLVYAYDNAKVTIDNKGYHRQRVYNYSHSTKFAYTGEIIQKDRDFNHIYAK